MGQSVHRVGDPNTAGGLVIGGDSTVLVNGRPIAVVGNGVTSHPSYDPPHSCAQTRANQTTVMVNGKLVSTTGAGDTCGHPRAGGSPDVFVG